LNFPADDGLVAVTCRSSDDLPTHVKGTAQWGSIDRHPPSYYVSNPQATSSRDSYLVVEFINDQWFTLSWFTRDSTYATRRSYAIDRENHIGLGWWNESDPAHPSYAAGITRAGYRFPILRTPTTNTETPVETNTAQITEPPTEIYNEPLDFPDIPMTANATTVQQNNATTITSGGLLGVSPPIFDGTRSRGTIFWNTLIRYKLLNRNNTAISNLFNQILTALSYMRGPLIDDWVDMQSKWLEGRVNPAIAGHLADTDETLWNEFEAAFLDAWKDSARVTTAEDQLNKLTMKGLDVDVYIATFTRLATAAEFELDSKALVGRFRSGLTERVHRRILNRENIPKTLDEWKEAARKEIVRISEIDNANFKNQRFIPRDANTYQNNTTKNNTPVPMDVDATTIPFQKLTDADREKYRKEGRCFRCRKKGHMTRNCPKNNKAVIKTADVPTPTIPTTPTPTTTANVVKLTKAQQIRALEDAMTEEERGEYLDTRDGGEDFYDAGH
jgi:hypothetical protein